MHIHSKIEFLNISFTKFRTFQLMWRLLALILGEKGGGERIIRTQKSVHVSLIIYWRVTMHRAVRSVVSELQTSLRNVFARYTTLVCLVRAFKQRIKIPYPYRTFSKSAHRTSVLHFLAKIVSYRTVLAYRNVPYCHAWSELLQNVSHLLHQYWKFSCLSSASRCQRLKR